MQDIIINLGCISNAFPCIGFQGENEHRRIVFDAGEVYADYPDAVVTMAIKPPVGEVYPKIVTRDGNNVIWSVTAADVAYPDNGAYQLTFTNGTEIIKTYVGVYSVAASIIGNGQPPKPVEDWLKEAQAMLDAFAEMTAEANTLQPGSDATVELTEEDEHKVFLFGIPRGDTGNGIASCVLNADYTLTITFTDGNEYTTPSIRGAKGEPGKDGADGFSPVVVVSEITGGHRVVITDAHGDHTFDVLNGEDGFDPVVVVTTITGGHRVTVTDASGSTSFDVMDGVDGTNGTSAYVWIRYAAAQPTQDSDMKTTPDAWMGVYSGSASSAPTHYTDYAWYNIKGATGEVSQAELDAVESELKSQINVLNNVTFVTGKYIDASGNEVSNSSFKSTDYIEFIGVAFSFYYELYLQSIGNIVSFYDADKKYITGVAGGGNTTKKTGTTVIPENAKFVRFSHCIASGGITNPEPLVVLCNISNNFLIYNSVGTKQLKDESVSKEKCIFIIHDPETNYIDKSKYSNGYISSNGVFVSNNGWRATDYIKLQPGTNYYSSDLYGGYCAFYKSDKTLIAGYGANAFTTTSFTTPANTAFARFSINTSWQSPDNAWLYTKNELPAPFRYILNGVEVLDAGTTDPCEYKGNEISVFNKILCIGDSMTEGTFNNNSGSGSQYQVIGKYSYPTFLHKLTGVDVTNKGHGGLTSVQWYALESSSDLSGYDCAIIQLGINDVGTYGTWGEDSETAFSNIITKLKTENKNIKIFVANIIPATSYSSSGYKTFSNDMLAWLQTTYASDANVIPLDIQQYGHTAESSGYNCGHLSALGYQRLAEDYKNYISWYINHNKTVFREVQFIGTNYWYINPNS